MTSHNDATSIDIIHVFMQSANYVQREFQSRLSLFETPYHLTGPRLRVLSTIEQHGSIRMNEVAKILDVKARTVTDLVDALENEGLLRRVADEQDRRAIRLEITPQAKKGLAKALAYQAQIAEDMLSSLSADEQQQFLHMLQKLRAQ